MQPVYNDETNQFERTDTKFVYPMDGPIAVKPGVHHLAKDAADMTLAAPTPEQVGGELTITADMTGATVTTVLTDSRTTLTFAQPGETISLRAVVPPDEGQRRGRESRTGDAAVWEPIGATKVLIDGVPQPPPPLLTMLTPATVVLGSPSFTLHVQGSGFGPDAVIVFAAQDEPTTVVSPTEVTTGVDMTLWLGADTVPVTVRNGANAPSNPLPFTFTDTTREAHAPPKRPRV
jgi:hypothetical protein